jgi:hypothetical protein
MKVVFWSESSALMIELHNNIIRQNIFKTTYNIVKDFCIMNQNSNQILIKNEPLQINMKF